MMDMFHVTSNVVFADDVKPSTYWDRIDLVQQSKYQGLNKFWSYTRNDYNYLHPVSVEELYQL